MDPDSEPIQPLRVERAGASATATRERHGWELELTFPNDSFDVEVATQLLFQISENIATDGGGGTTRWRVPNHTKDQTDAANTAGLRGDRVLWQMRRPLPAPPPEPPLPTRAFALEADNSEWLRVNNAAFSWHPEQGGWTEQELLKRTGEPWFDPEGFLLYPNTKPGDAISGFCWTKIDRESDPSIGEIFVIAVDPAEAGQGLGRRLVLAGLEHLFKAGATEAMLYTEADNAPARDLYESLDFKVHQDVRVYQRDIPAYTPPTSDPMT